MFCTLNVNAFCHVYLAMPLVLIPTEYHYPLLCHMTKTSMLMAKVSTQCRYDSDPSQNGNLTCVFGGLRNRERARKARLPAEQGFAGMRMGTAC